MNSQRKVLLAAAAMAGLMAGASARAAALPTGPTSSSAARPATVTTGHHGVRALDGSTTKPAGTGSGKGTDKNGCPSVL